MTAPLLVLAFLSILGGLWNIGGLYTGYFALAETPAPAGWFSRIIAPFHHAPVVALASLAAVAIGAAAGWMLYARTERDPLPERMGALSRALRNRLYFDELYERLIAWSQESLATLADRVDRWVIAGFLVRGAHGSTEFVGRALRLVQTGNLQTYAFFVAIGLVLLLFLMMK
jgi:NADH-quinone oxidoreductase subunit L